MRRCRLHLVLWYSWEKINEQVKSLKVISYSNSEWQYKKFHKIVMINGQAVSKDKSKPSSGEEELFVHKG